jgi:hypothetical protein
MSECVREVSRLIENHLRILIAISHASSSPRANKSPPYRGVQLKYPRTHNVMTYTNIMLALIHLLNVVESFHANQPKLNMCRIKWTPKTGTGMVCQLPQKFIYRNGPASLDIRNLANKVVSGPQVCHRVKVCYEAQGRTCNGKHLEMVSIRHGPQ